MEMHPAGEPGLPNALAQRLEPLHVLRCKINIFCPLFFFFERLITLLGVWDKDAGCLQRILVALAELA